MKLYNSCVALGLLFCSALCLYYFLDEFGASAFVASPVSERIGYLSGPEADLPVARSLRSDADLSMACVDVLESIQFDLLGAARADRVAGSCLYLAARSARQSPGSGLAATLSALAQSHLSAPDPAAVWTAIDSSRRLARNVPWPAFMRVLLTARLDAAPSPEITADLSLTLTSDWGSRATAAAYGFEPGLRRLIAAQTDRIDPSAFRAFIRAVKSAQNAGTRP